MVISLCYSRKSTPKALTKRSLNLLGIIILLELFRTLIPGLIEWFITKDPETIEYLYDSLCVDILNFAMLSLLVIALFKKLKLKPIVMFIIACVFSIAGQLLQNVSAGVYFLDVICGYIWLTYDLSFFPLLNFFIFLVSGYIFGQAWIKIKDKETFFKITTPICLGITLIYYISMAVVKEWYYFSNGYFYGIGFIDSIFTLIIYLGMIGLGYYLHRLFKDKINFLASMGSRVTSFYCIQWVIISILFLVCLIIIGDSYLPQWSIIPVSIITIILSYIISLKYKEIKLKQQNFK